MCRLGPAAGTCSVGGRQFGYLGYRRDRLGFKISGVGRGHHILCNPVTGTTDSGECPQASIWTL